MFEGHLDAGESPPMRQEMMISSQLQLKKVPVMSIWLRPEGCTEDGLALFCRNDARTFRISHVSSGHGDHVANGVATKLFEPTADKK